MGERKAWFAAEFHADEVSDEHIFRAHRRSSSYSILPDDLSGLRGSTRSRAASVGVSWEVTQLCRGTQLVVQQYHLEKLAELIAFHNMMIAFDHWKSVGISSGLSKERDSPLYQTNESLEEEAAENGRAFFSGNSKEDGDSMSSSKATATLRRVNSMLETDMDQAWAKPSPPPRRLEPTQSHGASWFAQHARRSAHDRQLSDGWVSVGDYVLEETAAPWESTELAAATHRELRKGYALFMADALTACLLRRALATWRQAAVTPLGQQSSTGEQQADVGQQGQGQQGQRQQGQGQQQGQAWGGLPALERGSGKEEGAEGTAAAASASRGAAKAGAGERAAAAPGAAAQAHRSRERQQQQQQQQQWYPLASPRSVGAAKGGPSSPATTAAATACRRLGGTGSTTGGNKQAGQHAAMAATEVEAL